MIRLSLVALLGAVVAAVTANRFGGTLGNGVWAGYLLGAGITGLGLLYQRHALLYHPERVMMAVAVSFLSKLLFLLIGTLTFHFVEAAASRVDWQSFLVAYGVSVAILLPLGALSMAGDQNRRLQESLDPKGSV